MGVIFTTTAHNSSYRNLAVGRIYSINNNIDNNINSEYSYTEEIPPKYTDIFGDNIPNTNNNITYYLNSDHLLPPY
jgi:hypothetical protein